MPKRLYMISIRWVLTPAHPPLIDAILGLYGDWVRYSIDTWFLWSDRKPSELRVQIMANMSQDDSVFIVPFEVTQAEGWIPHWIWNWFYERVTGSPLPGYPPPQLPKVE